MAQFERPKRDLPGKITETPEEATQSERSLDSFSVLTISLLLAVVVGVVLFWYWGMLPWEYRAAPVQ